MVWRRVPLSVSHRHVCHAIDGDTAPIPWVTKRFEPALAGPTKLVEQGLPSTVLSPNDVRAHLSNMAVVQTYDLLFVSDRLLYEFIVVQAVLQCRYTYYNHREVLDLPPFLRPTTPIVYAGEGDRGDDAGEWESEHDTHDTYVLCPHA